MSAYVKVILLEPWVRAAGCESTWSWREEGGTGILGEAGGAWTVTTTGHFFPDIQTLLGCQLGPFRSPGTNSFCLTLVGPSIPSTIGV